MTFWRIHSEIFQIVRNNNKKHLKWTKDNFTMTCTLRQNNANSKNCTFFLLLDYYINCCKWWKCQSLRFRLKFRKRKQDRKCTCAAPPPHILLLFPNSGQNSYFPNLKKKFFLIRKWIMHIYKILIYLKKYQYYYTLSCDTISFIFILQLKIRKTFYNFISSNVS